MNDINLANLRPWKNTQTDDLPAKESKEEGTQTIQIEIGTGNNTPTKYDSTIKISLNSESPSGKDKRKMF